MNLYVLTGHTKGLGAALAQRIARLPDNEIIALGRAPDGPIAGGAQLQADFADPPVPSRRPSTGWRRASRAAATRRRCS